MILPGTHSKWARVGLGEDRSDPVITKFLTFMTGEVFALLRTHSILGKLMPDEPSTDVHAFDIGATKAMEADTASLLSDIFTVRTSALAGSMPPGVMIIGDWRWRRIGWWWW